MDSNYKFYNYETSFERIDNILALPGGNYEEVGELPDRDRLTYSNGFYAYCTAVFADIRESSKLPSYYKRPQLAKLYRSYISEMVAILNSTQLAREINILGDGVWAVFNTPQKTHIDDVFALLAKMNSLLKVLNYKLTKAGYEKTIDVGFGAAYGRALMIKAGYSGSGISDVVYMGDVVNEAAKLAAEGAKGWLTPPMMIQNVFAENLNTDNLGLLMKDWSRSCYTGNIVNMAMDEWYTTNCK